MLTRFFDLLRGKKQEQDSPKEEAKGEDIRIGVLASQSGPLAYSSFTAVRGFQMGLEYATRGTWQVAGHKIRLIIDDDAGDPKIALEKAQKLLEVEQAHILCGCGSSAVAVKIAHDYPDLNRIFMVAVAATDVLTGEWLNRHVFRTASSTSQDAMAGGKYLMEHFGKRVFLLSSDYIWGQQSRAAWWKVVTQYGGEIVGDTLVAPGETNFDLYLKEVLAKSPDVVIPSWAGSGTRQLLIQLDQAGVTKLSKIAGGLAERDVIKDVGDAVAGMLCSVKYYYEFPKNPVNDWLVSRHQERFGEPPDVFTESGFSAAVALVTALEKTNGSVDTELLISTMEGMSFDGPKGLYTFRREDHQALQPMYLAELVNEPGQNVCVPHLIREISAEESAPPLIQRK